MLSRKRAARAVGAPTCGCGLRGSARKPCCRAESEPAGNVSATASHLPFLTRASRSTAMCTAAVDAPSRRAICPCAAALGEDVDPQREQDVFFVRIFDHGAMEGANERVALSRQRVPTGTRRRRHARPARPTRRVRQGRGSRRHTPPPRGSRGRAAPLRVREREPVQRPVQAGEPDGLRAQGWARVSSSSS
jgi:hypothetical protein